ncbi:hypothetical protein BC628DRAFT_1129854 [Trametes gibbosa]|nr:hypothetical protein BC628DRAFT_1129854 [Trametes gibbosa]
MVREWPPSTFKFMYYHTRAPLGTVHSISASLPPNAIHPLLSPGLPIRPFSGACRHHLTIASLRPNIGNIRFLFRSRFPASTHRILILPRLHPVSDIEQRPHTPCIQPTHIHIRVHLSACASVYWLYPTSILGCLSLLVLPPPTCSCYLFQIPLARAYQ